MADFSYDVVRERGKWRVQHLGRINSSYPDQDSAIRAARKLAKEKVAAGRDAEVRLNRTDGAIVIVPLDESAADKDASADTSAATAGAPATSAA